MSALEFWSLTVHELQSLLLEEHTRADLAATRDRAVAWMTAALGRAKRMPKFDQFVQAAKPKRLTPEEMAEKDRMIEELAASAGLVVQRDD